METFLNLVAKDLYGKCRDSKRGKDDELHSDESLDSFWSWGELMLADFDDVDRNLALADQLFSLLREQRELTDDSFLTDKQREALNEFFKGMRSSQHTQLRDRHVAIWSV